MYLKYNLSLQNQQDTINLAKYTLHQMLTKERKGYELYILMA